MSQCISLNKTNEKKHKKSITQIKTAFIHSIYKIIRQLLMHLIIRIFRGMQHAPAIADFSSIKAELYSQMILPAPTDWPPVE